MTRTSKEIKAEIRTLENEFSEVRKKEQLEQRAYHIELGESSLGKFFKNTHNDSYETYYYYESLNEKCVWCINKYVYNNRKTEFSFYRDTWTSEEIGESVKDNPEEITEEEFLENLEAYVKEELGKYGESIRLR